MRSGYLEAQGGYTDAGGWYGRAEAGAHILDGLTGFGFGQYDRTFGATAGLGVRYNFNW